VSAMKKFRNVIPVLVFIFLLAGCGSSNQSSISSEPTPNPPTTSADIEDALNSNTASDGGISWSEENSLQIASQGYNPQIANVASIYTAGTCNLFVFSDYANADSWFNGNSYHSNVWLGNIKSTKFWLGLQAFNSNDPCVDFVNHLYGLTPSSTNH